VAGSRELIDYLRYYARTYFFSTSLPARVAGLIEVFRIMSTDLTLHAALWENIRYLKAGLTASDSISAKAHRDRPGHHPRRGALEGIAARSHGCRIFANYVAYRPCRSAAAPAAGVTAQLTRADLDYVLETFAALGGGTGSSRSARPHIMHGAPREVHGTWARHHHRASGLSAPPACGSFSRATGGDRTHPPPRRRAFGGSPRARGLTIVAVP